MLPECTITRYFKTEIWKKDRNSLDRRVFGAPHLALWRSVLCVPYFQCRLLETLTVTNVVQSKRSQWWKFTEPPNQKSWLRQWALCPGLPQWVGTRKVKPIRILLKQQTVSGSGVSWAICKAAPRSRQINMPAPHHSCFLHVFYRKKWKNVSTTMTRSAAIAHCSRTARSSLFLEILSSYNICTNSVIVFKNRPMYIMNINVLQK